jgi:hypothetical protein
MGRTMDVGGNMQLAKTTISCLIGLILFASCSPGISYVKKYGLAYNSERERLGIPPIPSTWTIQDMGNYFDCFDPNPSQKMPHRLFKRVFIENGIISKETDTFYNGKTFYFAPEQITLPQEVSLEYDYLRGKDGNPWKAHADLNSAERSKSISIEEARQILTEWGLWKPSGWTQL